MTTEYIHLNGMTDGPSQYIDMLGENLIAFFEWGLIEAGQFDDVTIHSLGTASEEPENLKPVKAPGLGNGKVWEAPFRNWVYESDLESTRQPIAVTGVYVNSTFVPVGSGLHINYPEGRAVFTTAVPVTSVVQATYSHRRFSFYDEDVPWFNELLFDSYNYEQPTNTVNPAGGVIDLLNQHGVKLPLVVIEPVNRIRQIPKQIGDISTWVYPEFLFHVVAETAMDRNNLVHIIIRQKYKTFFLYNTNERARNNAYALDFRGMKVDNSPLYPELVQEGPEGYRFRQCRFFDTSPSPAPSKPPIFRGIVRVTLELDLF